MKMLVISLIVAAGGTAVAAPYGEPAYVPPQKRIAGVQLEWMPAGGIVYASNQHGEIDGDLAMTAGISGWVGWEFTDRIEIGLEPRYISGERIVLSDGTLDSGSELIVAAPLKFHGRWWEQLDFAFVLAPGYSHVFLPSSFNVHDASGFTVDFAAEVAYPLDGRLWGVASFGYQRGFQRTLEKPGPLVTGSLEAAWATDYTHVGFGVATRF